MRFSHHVAGLKPAIGAAGLVTSDAERRDQRGTRPGAAGPGRRQLAAASTGAGHQFPYRPGTRGRTSSGQPDTGRVPGEPSNPGPGRTPARDHPRARPGIRPGPERRGGASRRVQVAGAQQDAAARRACVPALVNQLHAG